MKNEFNFQEEIVASLARLYRKSLSEAVKKGIREAKKRKNNETKTI